MPTFTYQGIKQEPFTEQTFNLAQPTLQPQVIKQQIIQEPTFGIGVGEVLITPTTEIIKTPITFPPIPPKQKLIIKPKRKSQYGYYPEAKTKFTKKWTRLSNKPMSRIGALSRMGSAVDNTIAATGRIRRTKKRVRKIIPGRQTWYSRANKFREYKIRKGKRIQTPDMFIEKKGKFRIDTLGEKQNLKLAKFIKQQGFLKKPGNNKINKGVNPFNKINKALGF